MKKMDDLIWQLEQFIECKVEDGCFGRDERKTDTARRRLKKALSYALLEKTVLLRSKRRSKGT